MNSYNLAAAAILSLSFSLSLPAQGTVQGRVTRSAGSTPIAGAEVRVVGTPRVERADSLGRFRFERVATGRHELEARALGHTLERFFVLVREGETAELEIRLVAASRELAGVRVIGAASDALARVPGSAAVITTRTLEGLQPRSANDALRTVAGVHVQEEEGAGLRANIGVRGLDPDRSRNVLVLEDGVPVALAPYGEPELYYSPPVDRMSRIEVLKGSGSILFGPQTIGGVVNYVTADPPAGHAARLEFRGGGGNARLGKLSLGGTMGRTGALVTAFDRSADDVNGLHFRVRDVTGKVGVRTAVGEFGAKLSLYDEASNSTYLGLTDSLYRAAPFAHPSPGDRLAIDRQAVTLSHGLDLGPTSTVRTIVYGYHTARDWTRRDYTYGPSGGTLRFADGTGSRNRSFDVFGVEPRVRTLWSLGRVTSDLDLGVRYHRERARDRYLVGSVSSVGTSLRDDELREGEAFSAWMQNRFALAPGFDLTPGVRLERFRFARQILRTRVRRTNGTTTTRLPEDVDIRSGDAVSELIPGLGATWSPRTGVMLFAGAHRGFAPPRTKDALIYVDPTLSADAQVPDPVSLELDAERSWNYEAGARLAPRDFLSVEVVAFQLDFTNQIIAPSLSAGSTTAAALANQGATRHRGMELGGRIDLGQWSERSFTLALEGNVTIVRSEFSRDRFLPRGADTVNVRGNALPYAPRHRAHAALVFEHSSGLGARLDASFVGAQFTDNFETEAGSANGRVGRLDAHRIFDASVRYDVPRLSGVTASASVKNLAGASFIASRRPEGIKVAAPRLVTLGLAWAF